MFELHTLSMKIVTPPFVEHDLLAEFGGFTVPEGYFFWEEAGVWVHICSLSVAR
jgi:hypothetical protein